jgi:hypothetical protein
MKARCYFCPRSAVHPWAAQRSAGCDPTRHLRVCQLELRTIRPVVLLGSAYAVGKRNLAGAWIRVAPVRQCARHFTIVAGNELANGRVPFLFAKI